MKKQYAIFNTTIKEMGERVLRFIITDDSIDRDREILTADGWEFDNYKKNPVFLWAHDYRQPPIGKAINLFQEGGQTFIDVEFPTKETYPFADTVYKLYKEGYLNATSIGFIGKEYLPDAQNNVVLITKKEMLEGSAVPVPANPNALQTAKEKGVINDQELSTVKSFIADIMKNEGHCGKCKAAIDHKCNCNNDNKGLIVFEATDPADISAGWDQEDAIKKLKDWAGFPDDLNINEYGRGFAYFENEKQDTPEAYKFAHHTINGNDQLIVVFNGVKNAMSDLLSQKIEVPENEKELIYNHLAKHYEQFEETPPELKEYTEKELKKIFQEEKTNEYKIASPGKTIEEIIKEKIKEIISSGKVGRVISAKNEKLIKKAITSLEETAAALKELLEKVTEEEDPDKTIEGFSEKDKNYIDTILNIDFDNIDGKQSINDAQLLKDIEKIKKL
jgi:HK97 family phage prohead protease